MKHVLILGAKSDIAKAIAVEYAIRGYHLILAGREIEELTAFSNQLKMTYDVSVQLKHFDALDCNSHKLFVNELKTKPYGIICCVGYLGDQTLAEKDTDEALKIIQTNYTGCVSVIEQCVPYLEEVNQGFIVGISSVAGDRGRKSNYFYGSAKSGFTAYLSGLRARLKTNNIHVLTVKPGFVATKMTAHLDLPKMLTVSPQYVAKKIFRAQQKRTNVLYVKWIWQYIMCVIKLIPELIFKKMNL